MKISIAPAASDPETPSVFKPEAAVNVGRYFGKSVQDKIRVVVGSATDAAATKVDEETARDEWKPVTVVSIGETEPGRFATISSRSRDRGDQGEDLVGRPGHLRLETFGANLGGLS